MTRRSLVCCLILACGAGLALAAQEAPRTPKATPLLKVAGEGLSALELTPKAFGSLPRQAVTARGHDGKESRYEGVPLIEVLRQAGLPTGKELRGQAVTLYLVVEAADGYRAVFALPELDPAFSDRVVLLADHRDGQPLTAKEGPLQVIVPGEKRHARWVRQVTALRVNKG